MKEAYDSKEYQEFAKNRGFGVRWAGPADFAAMMAAADEQMGDRDEGRRSGEVRRR